MLYWHTQDQPRKAESSPKFPLDKNEDRNIKNDSKDRRNGVPRYFLLRLLETIKLPYWVTCLLYGLLVFAALLSALLWVGEDISEPVFKRSLILIPFLCAWVPYLNPLYADASRRMKEELKPALKIRVKEDSGVTDPFILSSKSLWLWTLVFQAIGAAAQLLGIEHDSAGDWVIFGFRQWLFLHYTTYLFVYAQIRGISQFVNANVQVSVHLQQELLPIGRAGVKLAFAMAVGLSIVGAAQILITAQLGVLVMSLIMAAPGYALVVYSLLLPTRPVRLKMRAAKKAEMRRIHDAIANSQPLQVLGEETSGVALLSYRDRVHNTPLWPLDLATARSVAATFVLPIFSWIAAVFVEMGVQSVMN